MPRVLLCLWLLVAAPGASGQEPAAEIAARTAVVSDAVPRGPGVAARLAEISRRVQTATRYPAIARQRRVSGTTRVSFEIGSGGVPRRVETTESSGHPVLDRAALRAVEDAKPLPFVYGRITVPVEFSLREE
jgi:protein TonB